jgi:SAM-dependent methyltransferase
MKYDETDNAREATDNSQQDRFWNGPAGQLWVTSQEETERHVGPFGDAALQAAAAAPGERAIDVGCGCGTTTLALARSVGATGEVVGVDLSNVMLERARESAAAAKLTNVDFRRLDAQVAPLDRQVFDLVYSRFGVMFFADPTAAFTNLFASLRPSGRLAFVCWQVPNANPWMALPTRAAMQFFGLAPPAHDAPGPFSLADPDRLRRVLTDAGFNDIDITPEISTLKLAAGQSIESWVQERLLMGLAGENYANSSVEIQSQARELLISTVEPYRVDDRLEMNGAAWIVTARA